MTLSVTMSSGNPQTVLRLLVTLPGSPSSHKDVLSRAARIDAAQGCSTCRLSPWMLMESPRSGRPPSAPTSSARSGSFVSTIRRANRASVGEKKVMKHNSNSRLLFSFSFVTMASRTCRNSLMGLYLLSTPYQLQQHDRLLPNLRQAATCLSHPAIWSRQDLR